VDSSGIAVFTVRCLVVRVHRGGGTDFGSEGKMIDRANWIEDERSDDQTFILLLVKRGGVQYWQVVGLPAIAGPAFPIRYREPHHSFYLLSVKHEQHQYALPWWRIVLTDEQYLERLCPHSI
jgi:hypothetical protein